MDSDGSSGSLGSGKAAVENDEGSLGDGKANVENDDRSKVGRPSSAMSAVGYRAMGSRNERG